MIVIVSPAATIKSQVNVEYDVEDTEPATEFHVTTDAIQEQETTIVVLSVAFLNSKLTFTEPANGQIIDFIITGFASSFTAELLIT